MIVPPTMFRLSMICQDVLEKTLLIKTPRVENTTENPKTKNIVFKTMLILFIDRTVPFLDPNSVTVVPEIYARNAGIIGKIHGATNDPSPASNATRIVGSAMISNHDFSFKGFFHIFPQCAFNPFLTGILIVLT